MLKSKRDLGNDKRQSAGAAWTRQYVDVRYIFILTDFLILRFGLCKFTLPYSHHDTKLLLLCQSWQQVVSDSCDGASGPFNHQQRGSERDYWNTKASSHHAGQYTHCGPFETQGPGMNISWETELDKCDDVPSLDLIAAWMWNCGVWGSRRNDPLKDKQAVAANVTPQRGKNFHRGLSNVVYLFCVNCSDVWSALTLNWGITLLWGWAGYAIARCIITCRTLVSFVPCRFLLSFQGGNWLDIISMLFTNGPPGRATHSTYPAGHVWGNWSRRLGAGGGAVILTSPAHV